MTKLRPLTAATAAATMAIAGLVATAGANAAVSDCRVDYQVTNQWSTGFGANVTLTNLGDPLTGWHVAWAFSAGQRITDFWNAAVTQSANGLTTATNLGYNASLPTGASTAFGFNASWSGANPTPVSFTLDGRTCTGPGLPTTGGTTTPPTTSLPTSTPRPTTQAPTTPAATTLPPTGQPLPSGRPAECSGAGPIVCRYDVAPGKYDITVALGDTRLPGSTSIAVEARRLVLAETATPAGMIRGFTATVNVRVPEGQPTGQGGTGTPGLTITLAGSAPRLAGLRVSAAARPLVAYLAGDSTVCDQPASPYTGWGQILPTFVKAGTVVANYGDSGESSASFLSNATLFPAVLSRIRAGDLVFIQFGHNDKTASAATYRQNLTTMVTRARAAGGIPVLVTPPVRRLFSGAQLTPTALHVNSIGVNLPTEMKQVAATQRVPLIDLTSKSKVLVEGLGPSGSSRLYLTVAADGVADNTHFSQFGASQMATLVVQGIRELNLTLAQSLRT